MSSQRIPAAVKYLLVACLIVLPLLNGCAPTLKVEQYGKGMKEISERELPRQVAYLMEPTNRTWKQLSDVTSPITSRPSGPFRMSCCYLSLAASVSLHPSTEVKTPSCFITPLDSDERSTCAKS